MNQLSKRPPLTQTDQLMTQITGDTAAFTENGRSIIKRQYDGVPRFKEAMAADPVGTLFRRVAAAVAGAESPKERLKWAQAYYDMMAGARFCPGGRVLAGAGSEHGNVLNCFVQGATEHDARTFDGVMEIAMKLALVTKVGGGNGVNLDAFNDEDSSRALSVPARGLALLRASHPDAMTFVRSEMTPSNNPDAAKKHVALRNWNRALVVDTPLSEELRLACETFAVAQISPETYAEMQAQQPLIKVPDDLGGIVRAAGAVALGAHQGQLTPVIVLDAMRPEGTHIRGSGGNSSGPFSFLAELFDNFLTWANLGLHRSGPINTLRYVLAPVLRVVRQGGTRRGAGMATISVHNNHVLDFLTAKDEDREENEGDISTFNISILADTPFMDAVTQGGTLSYSNLILPPKKYTWDDLHRNDVFTTGEGDQRRTIVPALYIWNEIAHHAWQTGEPGLIFPDRVNHYSAINGMGEKYQIRSTNPCLAAGTEVLYREVGSGEGPSRAPVQTLLDRDVEVLDGVDGQWYVTRFRVTGTDQTVWNLETDQGGTDYFTPYHSFFTETGEKVELSTLQIGARLQGSSGAVYTVTGVGSQTRTEAEVYCCTVSPNHRFTLASGLQSGNCGEIPLTVGEPCDLGALNLAAYVRPADQVSGERLLSTTGKRAFDLAAYRADIRTAVRFLDNVLDINVFALEDNLKASRDLRRLGLGIMGLADALVLMEVNYGGATGRTLTRQLMTILREEATAASEELGQQRGIYPLMKEELDAAKSEGRAPRITHAPRRNVAVLTVAPTGTTSMAFGVSSGIEPIFSPFVWRKIGSEYKALIAPLLQDLLAEYPAPTDLRAADGSWDMDRLTQLLNEDGHGSLQGIPGIPEEVKRYFLCAHDISPVNHVLMQGTIQQAFDAGGAQIGNALSKTINLPKEATISEIREAYRTAYDTGCKGITVYRNGSREMQVLSTTSKSSEAELDFSVLGSLLQDGHDWVVRLDDGEIKAERLDINMFTPATPAAARTKRPATLEMFSYKVLTYNLVKQENQTYLVNVGHANGKIIEVQVLGGRAGDESNADSEALGRSISIALQHGSETGPFIKTLRSINGGLSGRMHGRAVSSKGDMIAVALEITQDRLDQMMRTEAKPVESIQDVEDTEPMAERATGGAGAADTGTEATERVVIPGASTCKVCNNVSMIREEGCHKCQVCGHAICG